MASKPPDVEISAVIPVGARHAAMGALYHEYKSALDCLNLRYEVIFVLDGLYPEAAAELHALRARNDSLVVVALTRAFGESTALMAGFERAHHRDGPSLSPRDRNRAAHCRHGSICHRQ